jgi:hypothetical protein
MTRLLSGVAISLQLRGMIGRAHFALDARNRRSDVVCLRCVSCAPGEIRTPNLLIRSQMLYPLSYGRLS